MLHSALRCLLLLSLASPAIAAEPLKFNRDVRPILAENCFSCHGPGKQNAGLRLDKAEAAYAKNKKGRVAAVPGKPNDSELLKRVFSTDDGDVMPPPDSHKKLKPEEKELLKRWITEGAVYEPHWSFTPIVVPAIPKSSSTNPIDAFLEARLDAAKLPINAEADKPTLIRRAAFALTGLPPTLKDVDAFLNDNSANAYERMLDHFFRSPHHGEEMARHWLDLARYGDTHGLHLDNERSIWLYRDWVVRAFNDNKRFDQFTIEQIAGDLLPNPTKDQLVATGFNRCNVSTAEGGSITEEWYFRNAVDRANVFGETFIGLSVGCAQCHDHKFDPISQKEYYSLYAFYLSADGSPLDGNALLHEPVLRLPSPAQEQDLKLANRRLEALDAAIATASSRYVDPYPASLITGAFANREAFNPATSFLAWLDSKGGPEAAKLPQEIKNLFNVIAKPAAKLNPQQLKQLRTYYLRSVCPTTDVVLEPLSKSRDSVAAEKTRIEQAIPATMIYKDAPSPRQAFVMARGQYNKPGDKVEPNTLAVLPPMPVKGRATRLDLARWLMQKDNPLTARVYVNRLWQQFFGIGLVKNSSDFGIQGDVPSHPELLDWLAAHFRDNGWNTRELVKLMLSSAAFKRSSQVKPEVLKADPENRLYARGPRFRLDAEQVRDNALFISGLLDPTLGGKGVKPYQPENIWEPVAFTGSNTQHYKQDSGSALYRRSLYTFFKRTAPPPFLSNFDTPNREQSCSRRDRSNTPLHALQLLNDVQHVEAARIFAERIISDGGKSEAERLTFAFKSVVSRPPTAKELEILQKQLSSHITRYEKAPAEATKLLSQGERKANPKFKPSEVAAYTMLASTILNLDETLSRN
jgi:hypothetical protein